VIVVVVGVVLVALVGVGGFYGGMVYGKRQTQTGATATQGAPGMLLNAGQGGALPGATGQGNARQGGLVAGEIQDIGNGVMTIVDARGKQTQIKVTDTTLIQKPASVTLADLQKGETVMVSGTTGSDGSITARSVQVSVAGAGSFQLDSVEQDSGQQNTNQQPGGFAPGGMGPGGGFAPGGRP
jgi:hypothetical protein